MQIPTFRFCCAFFAFSAFFCGESLAEPQSTYDVVVEGKICSQSSYDSWQCYYTIGEDVEIIIDAVENFGANLTFVRSGGYEGDYFPALSMEHGCVIIQHGLTQVNPRNVFDYAFISPKNGNVYKTWQECKQSLALPANILNENTFESCSDR